jgi:hypothetical protein
MDTSSDGRYKILADLKKRGEGHETEIEPVLALLAVDVQVQLSEPRPHLVSDPKAAPEEIPPSEEELWAQCKDLAGKPDILAEVWAFIQRSGVAGVEKQVKTVFLSTLSTLRWDPVNLAIKGPSAAGKSYMVKQTQVLFPPEAIYVRTSISPMTLAYSEESFVHRQITIFEQHGIDGEKGSYMIRTLLSEGEIVHEVTKETSDGNRSTQVVRKPGPTGFLTTTTLPSLHGENETRLFTIEVPDDNVQTRRIMRAIGAKYSKGAGPAEDVSVWHAFYRWLRAGERRVVVPFAGQLSELVPDVAIRLRRDFKAVVELVAVHALLHRASRERDADGQIIATVADYAAVRELINDTISAGAEQTVRQTVRDTVQAVTSILAIKGGEAYASGAEVALKLGLHKGTVSRRIAVALEKGYLRNLAPVHHRGGRNVGQQLVLGDAMPGEELLLPKPDQVVQPIQEGVQPIMDDAASNNAIGCTVAIKTGKAYAETALADRTLNHSTFEDEIEDRIAEWEGLGA